MGKSIIKIWADGCMNCSAMTPILDGMKSEFPDIKFRDLNTKVDGVAEKYEITSLPTIIFEKDGQVVGRLMGLKPKSLVVKKIAEVF